MIGSSDKHIKAPGNMQGLCKAQLYMLPVLKGAYIGGLRKSFPVFGWGDPALTTSN